jgi:hypothetical protein
VAIGLLVLAMRTKIELTRLETSLADTIDAKQREGLMKISAMWRRWLEKWNHRRRQIFAQQRANLERLVAMFVVSEHDYERMLEDEEEQQRLKSVQHGGRVPPFGASRPDLSRRVGGILVVRPHRPGSKWAAIQPPAPTAPGDASSRHLQPTF